jgi:trk system potassium uptake protein TrkA
MKRQIVVVGLGRFGVSVAETLSSIGHDVMAIDKDQRRIQNVVTTITHAIQADATNEAVLKEIGVSNFNIAVVAIGSAIESSVLATILLKKLGIPLVVARANNELHKAILERIGADYVISPEQEMGRLLAHGVTLTGILGYMDVTANYGIAKINVSPNMVGKSISEIGLSPKGKWQVAVLLIQHKNEIIINPVQSEVIKPDDLLILSGNDDNLTKSLASLKKQQE